MRLIPLITAVLVMIALYLAVFQRDAVLMFSRGAPAGEPVIEEQPVAITASANGPATLPPPSTGKVIKVVVKKSRAKPVANAVLLRGETKADRQVEVRSETTAIVISEPLRKGRFVETGEILCQLDPGTRESALAEARARLKEAQARVPEAQARLDEAFAGLAEAEINFNAASKLSEGGFASETRLAETRARVSEAQASIESARAGLKTAQAGIEAATASVASAEREIDLLAIEAPFSGLLESDTAELGSLMQPGSLCATVIRLNPIRLVGYVPETEVNRLEVGARAASTLADGQQVAGIVTFVSRSADSSTRTFLVEIAVNNDDFQIRDGQTAEIMVESASGQAHQLPQSALTLNNEGQLGVRTVNTKNTVDFVPVRVVRDAADGVWLSGLPDQADVIVVGQDFVTEGVSVEATVREITK